MSAARAGVTAGERRKKKQGSKSPAWGAHRVRAHTPTPLSPRRPRALLPPLPPAALPITPATPRGVSPAHLDVPVARRPLTVYALAGAGQEGGHE